MTIELPLIQAPEDFPDVHEALEEPNGLLGFGNVLSEELLIKAYYEGIFPWYNPGEPVFWWSPDPRAAFYVNDYQPSKSLAKSLRNKPWTVTLNQQFARVIKCCSERHPNRPDTWITREMCDAYNYLHELGFAHSIETWLDDTLVGGLYGINLGQCFFGESMFHRVSDASKVALHYLIQLCKAGSISMIDCQLPNPHLNRLGAKEVSREAFLSYLYTHRDRRLPSDFWRPRCISNDV